jgi:hypothetical protein
MSKKSDLLKEIDNAEERRQLAKKKIALLKKQLDIHESELIESSLLKERAQEKLNYCVDSAISLINTDRENEIIGFQDRNPELCQQALDRDLSGKKEIDGDGRGS